MTTSRAPGACTATVNTLRTGIVYTCTLPMGHEESHSAPAQSIRNGVPEVDKGNTCFTWSDSYAREAGWEYTSPTKNPLYDTSLDPISPNFDPSSWKV